jgi:hypothetical protein
VAQADETAVVSGLQENDKVQVKCLAEFFTFLGPLHFHSELTEQKAARSATEEQIQPQICRADRSRLVMGDLIVGLPRVKGGKPPYLL